MSLKFLSSNITNQCFYEKATNSYLFNSPSKRYEISGPTTNSSATIEYETYTDTRILQNLKQKTRYFNTKDRIDRLQQSKQSSSIIFAVQDNRILSNQLRRTSKENAACDNAIYIIRPNSIQFPLKLHSATPGISRLELHS